MKSILKSTFAILILLILLILFREKLKFLEFVVKGRFPYSSLEEYSKYGMIFRLIYYPSALIVMFSIMVLIPNFKISALISRIGQNTLPIYVFHFAFIHLPNRLLGIQDLFVNKFMFRPWLFFLLFSTLILIVLSSFVFVNFMNFLMLRNE